MVKGVIFAMDGTALDSMGHGEGNLVEYLKVLGVSLSSEERKDLKQIKWNDIVEYINKIKGTNFEKKAFRDGIIETHMEKYKYGYKLMPGFVKFLDYLEDRNIKFCIATATRSYGAEAVFERFGLMDRIEFIITEGTVGYTKNFPQIYLEAASRLCTNVSETVVFEDALYAIKTAKKAGFITIAVRDPFYESDHEEIEETSDLIIADFNELLQLIKDNKTDIYNQYYYRPKSLWFGFIFMAAY